ncbi:hypothetical protein AB3K25_10085 [Leuconostoc sp. MS02]|uniref:Uncharacterized protein n=1 Tax=Leuconostoc aquikimchii TaxID=3236804 RepID=A0ABV3RZZ7_9LACO
MIFNSTLCTALSNNDEEQLVEQLQPLVKKLSYAGKGFQEDLSQELNIDIITSYRKSIPLIKEKYDDFLEQLD